MEPSKSHQFRQCRFAGCHKEAISLSEFCGKHTANKDIIHALKNLPDGPFASLYLDEVEIKKLTLAGKEFTSATVQDTDFEKVVFVDCAFLSSGFAATVFKECRFVNCRFLQWDCKDVTFSETVFEGCSFDDWQLNQCFFGDETAIVESGIDGCEVIGTFFSETGEFRDVKLLSTNFVQASFAQARFSRCQFIEAEMSKTSLYDSAFTGCLFSTVSHDFKLTGVPMLCSFKDSVFENMTVTKAMRRWNNFKKDDTLFYLDIVEMILPLNHPNYLSELGLALQKLTALKLQPSDELKERIHDLFRRLLSEVAQTGNYTSVGNILSDYGKVPAPFRKNSAFLLPPPGDGTSRTGSRLTVQVHLPLWRPEYIGRFTTLLAELDEKLPDADSSLISSIENGSLIVQLLGTVKHLFAGLRMLVDLKKTKVEIDNLQLDARKKQLELKKIEIELAHYEKMKTLEAQKAELEVYEKKLQLIEQAGKQFGYDHRAYLRTKKGQNAEKTAALIQKEFPVLWLRLE